MSTPYRAPLADITSSSNTASPKRINGSKRSAPSPFLRGSASFVTATTPTRFVNKKRVLHDANKEQRACISELWTQTYRVPKEAELLQKHSQMLEETLAFTSLERQFNA